MPQILSSLACNLDDNVLLASLPIFSSGNVQAIEWSFDTLYQHRNIPAWFVELLRAYSNEKRLIGHGVYFSLFSGKWSEAQQNWLRHLEKMCDNFHFDHISEHFGFMTGEDFHKGAPMNIPLSKTTLEIGRDRLKRMFQACKCPVGLENLAFSYTAEDAKRQGSFLEELLAPVNGFMILDLHNIYCQVKNFDLAHDDILSFYPLERVREIHISGGSWENSSVDTERMIRRDTHDEAVPEEVFQLLSSTIGKCPNLKYVVLEQLGTGLDTQESKQLFREDFKRMDEIVTYANAFITSAPINTFLPENEFVLDDVIENEKLHDQQMELTSILENSEDYATAKNRMDTSSLSKSEWEVEKWDPAMLETAMQIARKWRNGFT